VGWRHRYVTQRLRRIVLERDDYQCQYPGCRVKHYLDVHHVIHWEDGGPTVIANLITYCGYHHRYMHDEQDSGCSTNETADATPESS
jgi:5-methylcytosine-specific restriction endonuclease McrA